MRQNKKGFTLIELLAVIVILAIIALIAVPVIMNIISSARKSAFEDTAYGIIKSGELYYAEQLLTAEGMTTDAEFTFTEGTVSPEGLSIQGSLPQSGKLVVTTDGKTAIAISDGTYCVTKGYEESKITTTDEFETCDLPAAPGKTLSQLAKTNAFATSVNACATSGTCAVGTPFAIEVAAGNIQNFYVISDENNKVTLIMDSNVGNMVAWGTSQASGPITALEHLESQTSGWTNIEAKKYTVQDDNEPKLYSDITRTNARARMITKTEANAIISYDWSYGNLDYNVGPWGYWTSAAYVDNADGAWGVDLDGNVIDDGIDFDGYFGIRPVIEISK